MRLAPVPMFYYPDQLTAAKYAAESSRSTHGADECLDACRLFAGTITQALAGCTKEETLFGQRAEFEGSTKIIAIADGLYGHKSETQIRGTGYVVDSLEAALWCERQFIVFSGWKNRGNLRR